MEKNENNKMTIQIKTVDRGFYEKRLKDFLPKRIIDFHTHVWLKEFRKNEELKPRGQNWPLLVAEQNSFEELKLTYELMFPDMQIMPMIFGWPETDVILDMTNKYSSEVSIKEHLPALIVSTPEWDKTELQQRVTDGKFIGLKPYLSWAPKEIPSNQITIYDFLPKFHLEVANNKGWIILLHIPRSERLKDPINLTQLLELEENYPNIKLVIAHIGRAYCLQDVGNSMKVLSKTKRMFFDFSGNTNASVMQMALEVFGPKRLLFGSDLPIVRMRMRRICENGTYINLVPPGLYGDIKNDPHMREVSESDAEQLSFFMYESVGAFLEAASNLGLTAKDIEDVFFNNAKEILESSGWNI